MKSDKGKTPLIVLRCADNRQLFEGTGKGNGKAMKYAIYEGNITKKLYVAFNKRLRDELGIKFQLVVYNLSADYMGVISVKNKVTDTGWSEAALVYWVTGAESGCAVNKSCQNKKYDGGFTVDTNYTQNELKAAIKAGEFTFHKVNGVVRVLEDINSMVTTSDTCGDVFKDNQTIRVIDQLGNDDAVLFNTKYLGVVPNNACQVCRTP